MIKNIINTLVSIYNKTHKDYHLSVTTYLVDDTQFFVDLVDNDDIVI